MENQSLYILLIEDNPAEACWLQEMLAGIDGNQYCLELANRVPTALVRLEQTRFSLILLDLCLADARGVETFRQIHNHVPDLPVIVLSHLDDEQLSLDLIEQGAQDYLVKSRVDGYSLNRAIRYAISRMRQQHKARQELLRSEKLAALGRLAAGLAHEVNNPLAIINSALQLMMSRWSPDHPDREFLGQVEEAIKRIAHILKGLVDFNRFDSNPHSPQDLNQIVIEFTPLFAPDLCQRNIQLELQLTPCLPLIFIAADEMKQVLLNLIQNARDAMPGGGCLTLATGVEGGSVYLRAVDTGIGLSPEVEKRLFEPFFSTKGLKSKGLGLAVVYGIVTAVGGTIQAENNTGCGCTFTVIFPRYAGELDEEGTKLPSKFLTGDAL